MLEGPTTNEATPQLSVQNQNPDANPINADPHDVQTPDGQPVTLHPVKMHHNADHTSCFPKILLYAFRCLFLVGFALLPGALLTVILAWTFEYIALAVLASFLFLIVGAIPDLILIYKAAKRKSELIKNDEYESDNDQPAVGTHTKVVNEKTKNSAVRCGLCYVQIIIPLFIAMAVAFFRFSLWDYKETSIAILYLPESELDGTEMGIHVRIPLKDDEELASFIVEYWPTDDPASKNTTTPVSFNVTAGGVGDVVLTYLEPNVAYTYEVLVRNNPKASLRGSSKLSGEFRSLPEPTNDAISFVSTSCTMFQMSLGRKTTIFNRLLDKGAQLGLFLGDFIYLDVPWAEGAGEGQEWRFQNRYRYMMSQRSVRNALGSIPFAWMFDDHEITNDFVAEDLSNEYVRGITEWRAFVGNRNPRSNEVKNVTECVEEATQNNPKNTSLSEIQSKCAEAFEAYKARILFETAENFNFKTGPAHFFVVDTRRFRFGDVIIGPDQTSEVVQWINDASAETVSFMVSATPWTLNYKSGWACCVSERDLILDAAEAAKARGVTVVFVSGDQHRPGIYELRPGIFEVSASPLDSTTTAWEWVDFSNRDIDNTIYEEAGFNHVFALWKVNATRVSVDIYAGGRDLSVVTMFCFLGGFLLVALLAFVFLKTYKLTIGVLCVALFLGILLGSLLSEWSLDDPRFSFQVER